MSYTYTTVTQILKNAAARRFFQIEKSHLHTAIFGAMAVWLSWYAKMGVSDFPDSPTAHRDAWYRTVLVKTAFDAPWLIDEMQSLPDKSW